MGSFNAACGLSNLSIRENDRAGVLLLGKVEDFDIQYAGHPSEGSLLKINVTDDFLPLLPPIFGKYDDYGNLKDIEESVTTKFLEKIYHKPIQIIMDCIGSSRSVYSSYGDIAKHYLLKGHLLNDGNARFRDILLSVDFTATDGIEDDVVYEFKGYSVFKLGSRWTIKHIKTGKLMGGIHTQQADELLDVFGEHTKLYPGFAPRDYAAIRDLNKLSGMFFLKEVFEQMRVVVQEDTLVKHFATGFDKDWDVFMETLTNSDEGGDERDSLRRFLKIWRLKGAEYIVHKTALDPRYHELLGIYKGSSEFSNLRALIDIATATNRMLAPAVSGGQYSNDPAHLALSSLMVKIIEARQVDEED